jgi:hypothetical protein
VRVHTWAGFLDGHKIVFIGEQRGVQGPLAAPPRTSGMDRAAVMVKNTMAVHNFHLGDITVYPPIFFPYLVFALTQGRHHTPPVILIERHGGLTLTAIAAALTLKYLFYLIHFYPAGPPGPSICK